MKTLITRLIKKSTLNNQVKTVKLNYNNSNKKTCFE